MEQAVVLCGSLAGLRASAFLADRGIAVRCLVLPLALAERGSDSGVVASWPHRELSPLARLWGDVIPLPQVGPSRALWWQGRMWPLPLSLQDRIRMMPSQALASVWGTRWRGWRWIQRDASYADWICANFGEDAWDRVYSQIASPRFAANPAGLSADLARRIHGRASPDGWWVSPLTPSELITRWKSRVLDAGGEVLTDVEVEEIEVERGRVTGVFTDTGREWVEQVLVTDLPLSMLAEWLPLQITKEIPATWTVPYAHSVLVSATAESLELPWRVDVADPSLPFWRLTRPGLLPGGAGQLEVLTAHLTLMDSAPLWTMTDPDLLHAVLPAMARMPGVESLSAEDVRIQRFPESMALPGPHHNRQQMLGLADRLGLMLVGERATTHPLDLPEELTWMENALTVEPVEGAVLNQVECARRQCLAEEWQCMLPRLRAVVAD